MLYFFLTFQELSYVFPIVENIINYLFIEVRLKKSTSYKLIRLLNCYSFTIILQIILHKSLIMKFLKMILKVISLQINLNHFEKMKIYDKIF